MSLWEGIDRVGFEKNLATLSSKAQYQGALQMGTRLLPGLLSDSDGTQTDRSALPAQVECRLANDFAFLASISTHPSDVSAAALHVSPGSKGIALVIAANEGIRPEVRKTFEQISSILEKRASFLTQKTAAEKMLLDVVVALHSNRILQRLELIKIRGPPLAKKDVLGKLQALFADIKAPDKTRGLALNNLEKSFSTLIESIEQIRGAAPNSKAMRNSMQKAIKAAFEMFTMPNSLIQNPRQLGNERFGENSRVLRVLRALANYWNICQYLTHVSLKYRRSFAKVELRTIQHGKAMKWQGQKKTVHAEIQILLYLEACSFKEGPRFISASKKPCMLCYSFVRAHARYSMCKSHGEAYAGWAVPDQVDLDATKRELIQSTLRLTACEVEKALKRAVQNKKKVTFHALQTVSKLLLPQLSSLVTSASIGGSGPSHVAESKVHRPLITLPKAAKENAEEEARKPPLTLVQDKISSKSTTRESLKMSDHQPFLDRERSDQTGLGSSQISNLSSPGGGIFLFDNLELIVQVDDNIRTESKSRETSLDLHTTITKNDLPSEPDGNGLRRFTLQELDGAGVTIERSGQAQSLQFMLLLPERDYLIRLRWR